MNQFFRAMLTCFVILAAFFFTFWVPGAFLYSLPAGPLFSLLLAIAAAVWAGKYVWRKSEHFTGGWISRVCYGAITLGAIGFVGGFFGPIIFAPEANQGPLLGIFITGPLGFILGGVGGLVYWFVVDRKR